MCCLQVQGPFDLLQNGGGLVGRAQSDKRILESQGFDVIYLPVESFPAGGPPAGPASTIGEGRACSDSGAAEDVSCAAIADAGHKSPPHLWSAGVCTQRAAAEHMASQLLASTYSVRHGDVLMPSCFAGSWSLGAQLSHLEELLLRHDVAVPIPPAQALQAVNNPDRLSPRSSDDSHLDPSWEEETEVRLPLHIKKLILAAGCACCLSLPMD